MPLTTGRESSEMSELNNKYAPMGIGELESSTGLHTAKLQSTVPTSYDAPSSKQLKSEGKTHDQVLETFRTELQSGEADMAR